MPKLIYAEPDDEITNLVDRLRSEKAEKELVFVLPAASRVMHSSLNARLLMQYSNSLGKKTSVVSPDSRTQGVAIDIGFAVYSTLAAFEAGRPLDHAVSAGAGAGDLLAPVNNDAAAIPVSKRPPPAPAVAPSPQARMAARRPAKSDETARTSYLPWVLAGIGVILILLIFLFFVIPSASVNIVTAANTVSATPTVTGSTTPPGVGDQLAVQTTIEQAQEQNQQQQIQSTGQKTIPAVAATGSVTITNNGFFGITFEQGKTYEVSTSDGKKFTFAGADQRVDPGQSKDFAITARQGGAAGNVAAHTITELTNSPGNLNVDNHDPTSGGVDASQKTVVSQTDLDNAKKNLGDPLTQKVKDDIKQKAGSLKVLDETYVINVDAQYDHKAGDESDKFNATVTVKGQVTAIADAKVKDSLRRALQKQVPGGYRLTDDPLKQSYKLAQHDDKGNVVFDGSVGGFMASAINTDDVKKNISGKSPAKARSYVMTHYAATDVIIRQSPPFIPWLPFIGGRIEVREQVENTTPT